MKLDGTWKNELSSILELRLEDSTELYGGGFKYDLSGTFEEGTGHGTKSSEKFDVKGVALEDQSGEILLSLQVVYHPSADFPKRGSIVNWSGRVISHEGIDQLFTVWTLSMLSETVEGDGGVAVRQCTGRWNHTLTNADTFTKI